MQGYILYLFIGSTCWSLLNSYYCLLFIKIYWLTNSKIMKSSYFKLITIIFSASTKTCISLASSSSEFFERISLLGLKRDD